MNYKNRVTPDNITALDDSQVFCFGSNKSGHHGLGAAKLALKWGAQYGKGVGLYGKTYAIPTVAENISRTLTVNEIKPYVDDFIKFAKLNPNLIFLVTAIGTGLAGLKVKDVAPLFQGAINIDNIHLPRRFWRRLIK